MKAPVLMVAVLASVGLGGCSPTPAVPPVTPFNFQSPYEGGFLATPMDGGQIRVVSSDFAGVEIGLCADESGGVRGKACGKDNAIPAWRELKVMSQPAAQLSAEATEPAPGTGKPPFVCSLSGGTFGQQSRLVSINSAVGASYGPANGKATVTYARYQLVYEWSRSVNVFAPVALLVPESDPVVTSADYGVALRLLMDVELKTTDAEVGANIGIAQLTAALATQQAMVNVRFLVLGAMTSFLPERAIRIDSASDLHEVMADFHSRAQKLSNSWEEVCKQSGAPGSTAAPTTPSSREAEPTSPATPPPSTRGAAPSNAAGATATSNSVMGVLRPVMLAYYVRGHQVGEKLRRIQEAKTRCVELKSRRRALQQQKALTEDEREEANSLPDEAEGACATAEGRGTENALSEALSQLDKATDPDALERTYRAILSQIWSSEQKTRLEQGRLTRQKALRTAAPKSPRAD